MNISPPSLPPAALLMTLVLALAGGAAGATALEDRVAAAPMPHTASGPGPLTTVHYVRLHTEGEPSQLENKLARDVEAGLRACLAEKAATGGKANPPRVLPQFRHGANTDTYYAPNRQITYRRHYAASLNPADCSLDESEGVEAVLESRIGSCRMNLTTGEAEGQCDFAAHARAPATPAGPPRADLDAQMARMAADPRTAAAAAQMRQLMGGRGAGGPAGEKKQVLGIACEVHVSSVGEVCSARGGGAFTLPVDGGGNGGMILETRLNGVTTSVATQAKLDARVSAAIFAPVKSTTRTTQP